MAEQTATSESQKAAAATKLLLNLVSYPPYNSIPVFATAYRTACLANPELAAQAGVDLAKLLGDQNAEPRQASHQDLAAQKILVLANYHEPYRSMPFAAAYNAVRLNHPDLFEEMNRPK